MSEAGGQDAPAIVAPSARPQFGDYQVNGVMSVAKRLKINPRELADKIVAAVDLSDIAENLEVAGPGFINITLKNDLLQQQIAESLTDEEHLSVPLAASQQTIVVDYSAPNLAKEMHVGHLRSTIIGDALARVLDFLGHTVIRQNHVGDWGTQFGKVILGMWHLCMEKVRNDPEYIERNYESLKAVSAEDDVAKRKEALLLIHNQQQEDLNNDWDGENAFHPYLKEVVRNKSLTLIDLLPAYQFVNLVESLAKGTGLIIDSPPKHKRVELAKVSSYVTKMLQETDKPKNRQEFKGWCYAKLLTRHKCDEIYYRLGVPLEHKYRRTRGESKYRKQLSKVIEDLEAKRLLEKSDGAQCVFPDEFKNKDGERLPVIVQKSDGGYLYATTDLAAIRYRVGTLPEGEKQLHADRILYVTDSRQALHFRQIFAVAKEAGFAPEGVSLEHVPFGTMMDKNNRPFKTREGGTVKLMDLLDSAERQALGLVNTKSPNLPEEQKLDIAKKVGIGAVKYFDLAHNRASDYVFSWDKMLALDGNTAPYMQYAYARIRSIFRKIKSTNYTNFTNILITDPAERALAVKLLQFSEAVQAVADESLPHLLCGYLFDLAGAFTTFYESCPVLKSDEPTRSSRLGLCEATGRTIRTGLGLLGIETVEQM